MKLRNKTNNDVYEIGRYISVLIKNDDKDEYYTMEFTSIKDLIDTLEDYEESKEDW